jgi:hypothetical protein
MKGLLVKTEEGFDLMINGRTFATTDWNGIHGGANSATQYHLSREGCDDIFGIVDVEKLTKGSREVLGFAPDRFSAGFIDGFNTATELNKDKLFTVEQVKQIYKKACDIGYERGNPLADDSELMNMDFEDVIKKLKQPTEIEVEIEMYKDGEIRTYKYDPNIKYEHSILLDGEEYKLDENGYLILSKI